jgi:hypothetical protein
MQCQCVSDGMAVAQISGYGDQDVFGHAARGDCGSDIAHCVGGAGQRRQRGVRRPNWRDDEAQRPVLDRGARGAVLQGGSEGGRSLAVGGQRAAIALQREMSCAEVQSPVLGEAERHRLRQRLEPRTTNQCGSAYF